MTLPFPNNQTSLWLSSSPKWLPYLRTMSSLIRCYNGVQSRQWQLKLFRDRYFSCIGSLLTTCRMSSLSSAVHFLDAIKKTRATMCMGAVTSMHSGSNRVAATAMVTMMMILTGVVPCPLVSGISVVCQQGSLNYFSFLPYNSPHFYIPFYSFYI